MTPTRNDIISDYWLDGLGHSAICKKRRLGRHKLNRLFRDYNIIRRVVGGKAVNHKVNRGRLELMLWPSVDEWEEMRLVK